MEYWKLFKDIFTIGATIFGGVIAYKGLSTWRRQVAGNKKFEVSFDCLQKMRILIETIDDFRSPIVLPEEVRAAALEIDPSGLDLKDSKEHLKASRHAYEMRWDKITQAYIDYEDALRKLEIILNRTRLEYIDNERIVDQMSSLNLAYIELLKRVVIPRSKDLTQEELDEIYKEQASILYRSNTSDQFAEKLNAFYENLNQKLRPYLD